MEATKLKETLKVVPGYEWCPGTGKHNGPPEIDHKVPWSKEGPSTRENGQVGCRHHNRTWKDCDFEKKELRNVMKQKIQADIVTGLVLMLAAQLINNAPQIAVATGNGASKIGRKL